MTDHQYLSIGEVLGLLLEDFPDVTISKIRFLESQGLIEPERTPSGYRKFYDHDVDLLRAILHEQKANFLPLKVIRDRIESGTIDADPTGGRTPPRGIRNVEIHEAVSSEPESRDSVFRRTDGGPEWADGKALIPGNGQGHTQNHPSARTPTGAVPVVSVAAQHPATAPTLSVVAALIEEPAASKPGRTPSTTGTGRVADKAAGRAAKRQPAQSVAGLPFSRSELCTAAGITEAQLRELDEFAIVTSRGSGVDATYLPDAVDIARIAGRFLEQGIDARHLRSWRQSAERESALFEQRIMPLLRQRNPQSRQQALDSLGELADLGSQLRSSLVQSLLRHHFEGS